MDNFSSHFEKTMREGKYHFCRAVTPVPVTFLSSEEDQKMVDFMVNLWTNFATYHDPTPLDKSWPSYGSENQQKYVRLRNSEIIVETEPIRNERLEFWKQMLLDFM